MNLKLRIIAIISFIIAATSSTLAEGTDSTSRSSGKEWLKYLPEIHGTVRPRMEVEFGHGLPAAARFQVRNARLSIEGKAGSYFDYFLNTDLCDCGELKVLDFWARVKLPVGVNIQAGQFRVPFGIDPFRAPHNYIFANRSFIGKQMCNVRAVGVKVDYTLAKIPVKAEAGMFNPGSISNHMVWNTTFAYAGKLTYTPGNTHISAGFASLRPANTRINLADAAFTWAPGSRWTVEAEYMYKHYTGHAHRPAHSWLTWANYQMPLSKCPIFNRLSFQGRYEGITAHSKGKCTDGIAPTDDAPCNRITLGSTISYYKSKNLFVDLRANYQKAFYHSGYIAEQGEGDKFLMELVVRF